MIHRIALLLGGLTAAGVLAFSLVRADRPALGADDEAMAAAQTDAPSPRVVVDTVYVAAPREPEVVHVTRRTTATDDRASKSTPRNTRTHRDDDERDEPSEREDHERRDHEREDHGSDRDDD
jgi:hypothetical protein